MNYWKIVQTSRYEYELSYNGVVWESGDWGTVMEFLLGAGQKQMKASWDAGEGVPV